MNMISYIMYKSVMLPFFYLTLISLDFEFKVLNKHIPIYVIKKNTDVLIAF